MEETQVDEESNGLNGKQDVTEEEGKETTRTTESEREGSVPNDHPYTADDGEIFICQF